MTKQQKILEYLQSGRSLTPRDAVQLFQCYCLSQTVTALKKKGHNIIAVLEHGNGAQWAKYSMMYSHGFNKSFAREKMEPKPIGDMFPHLKQNPAEMMP
jgi:hypothetical protein